MDHSDPTLFIVSNNTHAGNAVAELATAIGVPCQHFDSAEAFLEYYTADLAGCAVVDIHLKMWTGVELLEALASQGSVLPMILASACPDVRTVVRAMKSGALTVIEKPFANDDLVEAIRLGFRADAKAREAKAQQAEAKRRVESLSPDERRVVIMIMEGQPNKVIAQEFGSCRRTVERMRAKAFQKLGVTSAVQLPAVIYRAEPGHLGAEPIARPLFARMFPQSMTAN
jgi:two-component system, LuxR family, response regulator FixJ